MKEVRLDKYLTDCTKMSRKEAKECIRKGRVQLDGQVVKKEGTKVKEGAEVSLDGETLYRQEFVYLMMNKPTGVVSATKDRGERTVVDLVDPVPGHPDLFPVGRLDKESTGLLLLTNNGQLMDDILRGSNYHEKEYIVHVNKPITDSVLQAMAQGVPILDTITRPCKIRRMGKDCFYITLTQGLNRQIRRMCEYFDYRVTSLKRIRIMNIELGSLPVGKWRELTTSEIKTLKNLAQNKGEAE